MKNIGIYITLFLLSFNMVNAQEKELIECFAPGIKKPFKKGSMLVFWGWNRAWYSNSDIHFRGQGYDFQLNNVKAADRQTPFDFGTYFNPGKVTIPQTNAKVGYFIKDNVAIMLSLDHMKYVMKQDQTVDFNGHISDATYANMVNNGQVDLTDGEFLTFEHTDGLNYVNIGLEQYKNLVSKKNFDMVWGYGAGAGVLIPKTNAKLFGNERSDRFHLAGFGADVRTSINFILWKHIMARVEAKYGYINMPDVKTTLNSVDKASQDFVFGQINFGIGYTFNTRKDK